MTNFDPLKHLFKKYDFSGHLAKWVMLLTDFYLKFVSKKVIKGQVLIDQLAKSPSQWALPDDDSFPDGSVLKTEMKPWEIYFDESKCRTRSTVGVRVILPHEKLIPLSYHLNFLCTNNTIEYEALLDRLCIALSMESRDIKIFGDSQLVIKQINETYQEKHDKILKCRDITMALLENFHSYTIDNVPQKEDCHADAMASTISLILPLDSSKDYTFVVHMVMKPSIDDKAREVLMTIDDSSEWYMSIFDYLKYGTFLESSTKGTRDHLQKLAAKYTILIDVLYRRSFDGLLLRCLKQSEIAIVI